MSDAPPEDASPPKKPVKKATAGAKKKSEVKSDSGFGSVEKIDQQDAPVTPSSSLPATATDSNERKKSIASQPTTARPSVSDQGASGSPVKEGSAPPAAPVSSQAPQSKTNPTATDDDLPINVNPYEDMISRTELNNYKSACDSLIQDLQDRLSHEENAAANLNQSKKKLEGDIQNLKKDIENVELALQKVCNLIVYYLANKTNQCYFFLLNRLNKIRHPKTTRFEISMTRFLIKMS